ncbi:MAG: M23 family metallopeptidase [Cyanobacteria bacterium M_surface_10_m2_179]|nr:M23 family metallopeptidase [Cyanobacteria bacterium M_surface_10_m2_179]
MKPYQFLLTTFASTAAIGAAGTMVVPSLADSRPQYSPLTNEQPSSAALPAVSQLIAALPSSSDRLWVKVRSSISIEELASKLSEDESRLAKLNDVNEDHAFNSGDWLVLPSQASKQVKQLAAIDTSELRRTPPLAAPPEPVESPRIRLGETIAQIAQRYNLSIGELLNLNPGLQAARLVAGTQIRVAQSNPGRSRMILGLKPTASGGLSWPDQPDFGFPTTQPSDAAWIWPTKGVFTSGYGWRWGRMHKGIDVANNIGTPIVAARSGQVIKAGWDDGGYGYLVEILHPDGSRSRYAHNSRVLVRPGDQVNQGAVISQMGSTGRSTGPHLHFEILPAGRGAMNPLQFLPARA